jgi:hypothetical protein
MVGITPMVTVPERSCLASSASRFAASTSSRIRTALRRKTSPWGVSLASRFVEEALPELLLQLQDLLAERRLGDMALLRRAGEVPRAGHRNGIAELVHFHRNFL